MRVASLTIFIVLFLTLIAWLFLYNDIHAVEPQKVYRSAQLSPGYLDYLIRAEGIKSIVNLRGKQTSAWYQHERQVAYIHNVHYYDIALSSYSPTSKRQLRQLVHILTVAPKPVLVHCEGGADRSGLTSAVVLLLDNRSFNTAAEQYSWHYLVIRPKSTGRITLPAYQHWLEQYHEKSSHDAFIRWLAS